jgi:hypothetical protein
MSRSLIILLLAAVFSTGCKSYSRYAIDSQPSIAIDTTLLGMWRCAEDTDKTNFILVQNTHDIYGFREKQYGSMENYLAKETEEWQEGVAQGKWDSTNNSSIVDLRWDTYNKHALYWLTYFDHHGINPHYEAWSAYLSSVSQKLFLNLLYRNVIANNQREEGYLLVRIIKMTRDTVITAIVADQTLKNLDNSSKVRSRVTARVNDKRFYSDTMHFYRTHRYHATYEIATKLNNPK